MPADLPAESSVEQSLVDGDEKKKQQRRGRKKSKLEDMFPAYLQVGLHLQALGEVSALIGASRNCFFFWALVVAHAYNPSYSGGRDHKDRCSKPALGK
jgi:hypothetical protein